MTYPDKGYGPYGPDPWHQTSWDARAAGNFVCGGAGAGLVVFAAFARGGSAAQTWLIIAGLALVGLGLFSVSLELGRPLRAPNVIRNPRTSWMSREAWVAGLLFASGLAAVFGIAGAARVAAVLALTFVYCQARLLQGAKGIPAWREPMLIPVMLVTGLAEGGGLFVASIPLHRMATPALLTLFAALVVVRMSIWLVYRRRLARVAAGARTALDQAGLVLLTLGTAVPLCGVAAMLSTWASVSVIAALWVLAGLAAAGAGAWLKFVLVTRAGFNQGFALPHLPVRGVPR
jgi:phenylacetyl-CoA:acceptor oxidoreductase 26-kDa subunit